MFIRGTSREFSRCLKTVLAMAVLTAFLMPGASYAMDPNQIRFVADGVVPLSYVLPAPQIPQDSPLFSLIGAGWQFHQRITFMGKGSEKDILTVQVYLINSNEPVLGPVPAEAVTISEFQTKIKRLVVSNDPAPNFALAGKVIRMIVPSPFGNLVGASAVYTAGVQVDDEGNAVYTMLGGAAAGSHTTYSPTAAGTFQFLGSYLKAQD